MIPAPDQALAQIIRDALDEAAKPVEWDGRGRAEQVDRLRQAIRDVAEAFNRLDAVLPHQEREWQPIETAPKDGTRILLHPGPKGYSVVGRRSLLNQWWECLPGKYSIRPTHWQRLPSPPSEPPR